MKGICIMSEMKKDREELNWKEKYQKEHKLRQEAETETILVKGIGMNSPEMRDLKGKLTETEVILNGTKKIVEESFKKVRQMQQELDRVKEENNNLYLSCRNLQSVQVTRIQEISTYDLLNSDVLLIDEKALDFFNEMS